MPSLKSSFTLLSLVIVASGFFHLVINRSSAAQVGYSSPDNVWTRIGDHAFDIDALKLKPTKFAAFNLDAAKLEGILKRAPKEFTSAARDLAVMITLPLPSGDFGRFRVEESPIIAPKLAERYPWLKSYSVKGLDDRTASGRFEVTIEGFRGMVTTAAGIVFIDRATKSDARRYISYFKANLPRDPSGFLCHGSNPRPRPIRPRPRPKKKSHHALPAAGDSDLRIYRIAVAASSEYVNAIHQSSVGGLHGDPVTQALIAIHRTIDRVNQIYEPELGVRLELIADEPRLIFADAGTDPYAQPRPLEDYLDLNQEKIDEVVGYDSYDVGHLFLVHGGGVSSEPCACDDWFKANGVTGRADPQGDAFDVDYVAHELGHQFGASHSFNGTTGGCQFRNADTAYEPGSGSTIMGYASGTRICGDENVQDHSDDYFHAISLRQINLVLSNPDPQVGGCSLRVPTTNSSRPTVVGSRDYVIPQGTPFTLTATSAFDNDGDDLVYNWEEFDLGDPDPPQLGAPSEPQKIRPLFRSRKWSGGLTRMFPQLIHLLDRPPAGVYTAESLPTNNRVMLFRITARDQRGRYGYDESQVRVLATRTIPGRITAAGPLIQVVRFGPFLVTRPSLSAPWRRGSRHVVRWQIANTDLAPISCKRVTISLLIRGAEANPIFLAKKVPNNGVANVSIPPNTPLGNARVKVEAVGNIFFNIADADVQIIRR